MGEDWKCDTCKHAPYGTDEGECYGRIGECLQSNKFEPVLVKSCVTCQNNWGSEGNKIPCTADCGTDYHGWIPIQKEEGTCIETMTCIHSGQEKCKASRLGCAQYRVIHTAKVPVSMPVYEGDKKHIESNGAIPINPENRTGMSGDDMKFDGGKVDMTFLEYFPLALGAVCEVSALGAKKYSRNGFESVENARRRYSAAMLRHYFQEGTENDPKIDVELNLPHDYMVAWNALCRLELRLRGHKLPKD